MKLDSEDDRRTLILALESLQIGGNARQAYESAVTVLELIDKVKKAPLEDAEKAPVMGLRKRI